MQSSAGRSTTIWNRGGAFLGALLSIGALAALHRCAPSASADGKNAAQEAAQRLAERITAVPGFRGAFRLECHTGEMSQDGSADRWQALLRAELEKRSVSLTGEKTAQSIRVYIEETPAQMVLTAKVRTADEHEDVRIVAVPRAALPPASAPAAPVRLDRQMIFESAEHILAATAQGSGAEEGLLVLVYRNYEYVALRIDAKGLPKQSVTLNAANSKPSRDPRAAIAASAGGVTVQAPGRACEFSWESPSDLKCRANSTQPAGPGDTLLSSPCDATRWRVLNDAKDPTARGVLQLVPDTDEQASNAAAVLSEFPGPVLSVDAGANPATAYVVARNLRTGNYEVYKITLACGD